MADSINNKDNNIFVDGEEKFSIEDVSKGNAGYSFKLNEDWVKRWENIDNASYKTVRDEDQIDSVITSTKHMQFTHTQKQSDVNENLKKYIRLLMPKYTRRVEVEDLNRNFWVIGQALSAIGAYLFEQQKVTDIHSEVVYLNNFTNYPDYYSTKFDNFEESSTNWDINSENSILDRLEHFKKLYPQTILIIIPVIRRDNYKHNYYSTELYPGIAIYNPNHLVNDNNGWKIIKFTNGDNKTGLITLSSDSDITDQLLGTNTDDENNIYYGSYKQIKEGTLKEGSNESSKYYKACLRTIPHITYHLDSSNKVIIDEFIITLQDAAWRAAITTGENNIGALSATDFNENTEFKALARSLITRTFSRTNIGVVGQKVGFYLGEVLSTKSVQSVIEEITQEYNISINNVNLEPIIPLYEAYDDKTSKVNEAKFLLLKVVSSEANMQKVLGSDVDLEKVRILLGARKANLYKTTGNSTLQNYWRLENSNLEKINVNDDPKYSNKYNAAKETAYTGGAVYFPKSNYKTSFDYEFIANPLPVVQYGGFDEPVPETHDGYTVGGRVVQNNPEEWQGGRAMASYISASAIQNKRLSNERHSNIFYYYTVMTKDGAPITNPNSEWAVIYTQIYVCYGLLPEFYPEIDTSKGMFYFDRDRGLVCETENIDSPYHDIKHNPILPKTGISSEGNQTGTISGYNDDYKQNRSFFVSNYQRGWNIPADIMTKIIQYMRNNSISIDKDITINFNNTYSQESPWGTIGSVTNNQITAQTINRVGPKNCVLDTTKTITVPKEFNQIEVNNDGDIINIHNFIADDEMGSDIFLGSVVKVTTHIFKNDGSSSRKEWSIYDYKNQNFEISLTKPVSLSNSVKALRNENYDVMYVGGNIPGCSNLFEVWNNYSGTETGYKRYKKMLDDHSMPDYEQYPLNGNSK